MQFVRPIPGWIMSGACPWRNWVRDWGDWSRDACGHTHCRCGSSAGFFESCRSASCFAVRDAATIGRIYVGARETTTAGTKRPGTDPEPLKNPTVPVKTFQKPFRRVTLRNVQKTARKYKHLTGFTLRIANLHESWLYLA